jgi:multidrug efflux system membrane fusion protein
VKVTQQDDVQAVIASGVKSGEQVITSGFSRLTDGTKVTLAAADAAPAAAASDPPPDSKPAGERRHRQGGRHRGNSEAPARPAQ